MPAISLNSVVAKVMPRTTFAMAPNNSCRSAFPGTFFGYTLEAIHQPALERAARYPPPSHRTTNTQSAPLHVIVDRNKLVWRGLILISILIALTLTPWGWLFWPVAFALNDVLLYAFCKSLLFDYQLRVRRNYQWKHNMFDYTTGSGRDQVVSRRTDTTCIGLHTS